MLKTGTYLLTFLTLLTGTAAIAEDEAPQAAKYMGLKRAVRFDVSPPLRDIPPVPLTSQPGNLVEPEPPPSPMGPQDADPVLQTIVGPPDIPGTSVSFTGFRSQGATPPDPVGAVGPNHYVAMANTRFAVYDKSGTLLMGPSTIKTLWSGFGGNCETRNDGDPIILYDQLADRWLLTQFTTRSPYYNCVALSTSGDPTGSYYRWAFTANGNFPDYPKYGMWPDAYYISTREFSGSFVGVGTYAANRTEMLAGNPNPRVISMFLPKSQGANIGDGLLPTDLDGTTQPPAGSPNFYLGMMDTGYGASQDGLPLWKFQADWTTPSNSTMTLTKTISTAAFDARFPCSPGSRNCIPQPGTTNKVDFLNRRRPLFRLAYRNFGTHASLVTNHSIQASGTIAGIRWYEIRDPDGAATVYQQGSYAPGVTDGIHRWMGSVAMDGDGDMALGYSASNGTTTFPSVWYTGRLATDPLSTMPQGEGSVVDGQNSQTNSDRWGDYTAMTVDPSDDCTFWYINEFYQAGASRWDLRIGAFKFTQCTGGGSTGPDVDIVTGLGPGFANSNNVLGFNSNSTSNGMTNFTAYSANRYGTNVSLNSFRTVDSTSDILTGPGPGTVYGPQVRGWQIDGTPINGVNFFGYGTLRFGVHANGGDVDGDLYEEILTAPGPGSVFGPHIRGWNYDASKLKSMAKISFFAYKTLRWGAQVAAGEIDNDAYAEILTGPGAGQVFGSQVRGFNYDNNVIQGMTKVNFVPYTTNYGVHVSAGDFDADGIEELETGPGPDPAASARIRGFNYDGGTIAGIFDFTVGTTKYGATIDAADLDDDTFAEIISGVGYAPTNGAATVRGYNYDGSAIAAISTVNFTAYTGTQYGVNVAIDKVGP